MEYARKYDPEVFESCMKSTHLRLAYTLIDNLYGPLVEDFDSMLVTLAAKLSIGNVSAEVGNYEGEKSFIIRTRISSTRSGTQVFSIFSDNIKLVNSQLDGNLQSLLEDFRIKGATFENYQTFY